MQKHTEPIRVVVGRVGRPHGISGDLQIEVRTDEPELRFSVGSKLFISSDVAGRTLTVAAVRWHSGRLLVKFVETIDRTAAEALRGVWLEAEVDPEQRPTASDEYYDRQLIGLEVRVADRVISRVQDVMHLPGQDVLVFQVDGREVMVPFVAELVPDVSISDGYLTVNPLPGLLDDQAEEVRDAN